VILSSPFLHCKAQAAPCANPRPDARLFVQPRERYTRPRRIRSLPPMRAGGLPAHTNARPTVNSERRPSP